MKIYTKTGDKGKTSLLTGIRVSKNHPAIEAYGTVDELIAFLGLVRDSIENQEVRDSMVSAQDNLMVCAAMLRTSYNLV